MVELMNWFLLYLLLNLITWFFLRNLNRFYKRNKKTQIIKIPPGPKPYPIIGNLLELGNKPHKSLAKLSQTYGPIMSLKLGQVTTVVFSSSSMAREIFQTHDHLLSSRNIPDAVRAFDHYKYGLAWTPISTTWRTLRKICNVHLFSNKALNSGMDLRQRKIREHLLSDIRESAKRGDAVEIGAVAFRTALNLMSTTFFSVDLSDSSSELAKDLKETIWKIMVVVGETNVSDVFPLLRWLDPQGIRRRATCLTQKLVDIFEQILSERLSMRDGISGGDGEEAKDVLDILIGMIGEEGREDRISRTIIIHLLLDLFTAGTETTSSTLEWSMAELLKAPNIMSKANQELNKVIGRGNQVNESDITQLPYLQAIVKETLRLHPPVPLLLPRKASADVEIGGYTVPKGTQVLVNAWAISRDPVVWVNPEVFMPERFLGSVFEFRGGDVGVVPFGGGRRICPGMPMALRMLNLMLASLIHNFDWKLENGVDMDDKFGLTLQMAKPLRAVPISNICQLC